MKYLILLGIILGMWFFSMLVYLTFSAYTKGNAKEYEQALIETGNNIFIYGILSEIALFLISFSIKPVSYVIIGIFAIMTLLGLFRLLIMLGTTIPLSFRKSHHGINNTGKLSDWIFALSSVTENAFFIVATYTLYNNFIN